MTRPRWLRFCSAGKARPGKPRSASASNRPAFNRTGCDESHQPASQPKKQPEWKFGPTLYFNLRQRVAQFPIDEPVKLNFSGALRSLFASPRTVPVPVPPPKIIDVELTATAVALLRGIGCTAVAERVAVSWSKRLSSSAGVARPSAMTVVLNSRLVAFPEEIDRTLRHELAHLVAFARARRTRIKAHGEEWRRACAELGIPGESRCHALPLPRRNVQRPYVYRCPACGLILQRVRRINVRRRKLACRECCRRHAAGRFDGRFQFVEVRPEQHVR